MGGNRTSKLFKLMHKIKYRLILEGIIVGLVSGLVVSFYRYVLGYAENAALWVYKAASSNLPAIILTFAVLAGLGIVTGLLVKSEPMIKGSGIPQVEGIVLGRFNPVWYKVLIKKFIGGVIAIGAGLSLGREGPSIQLGASIGQGLSKLLKRMKIEEKYLTICGSSAGLAAAFNAPFAGVMFALEEIHKSFSPNVLLSAMAAAITSDLVSKSIFGMNSVFQTQQSELIPMQFYILLAVMGALLGICGTIYNFTLIRTQDLYARLRIPDWSKPVIPFILAGILGMVFPYVLGGGHSLIEELIGGEFAIGMILLLLIVKFAFSMLSFGSGTPGGIFFPLLVLGALVGALCAKISIYWLGLPEIFMTKFILLGMVGMFTAIVRAPITGIILIVEMSGSLTQMLSLTVVAVFSYLVAEALGSKPIYDALLIRMSKSDRADIQSAEPVLITVHVPPESAIAGKTVRDIDFPKDCLLVSIQHLDEEIIPHGEVKIMPGDNFTFMCGLKDENKVRKKIHRIMSARG